MLKLEAGVYLEHYGKKGMRWGKRKARRKEKKEAAKKDFEQKQRVFMDTVMKDVKTRSLSELYAVTGTQGRFVATGAEVIDRVNTGMKISSLHSTGMKINDGK